MVGIEPLSMYCVCCTQDDDESVVYSFFLKREWGRRDKGRFGRWDVPSFRHLWGAVGNCERIMGKKKGRRKLKNKNKSVFPLISPCCCSKLWMNDGRWDELRIVAVIVNKNMGTPNVWRPTHHWFIIIFVFLGATPHHLLSLFKTFFFFGWGKLFAFNPCTEQTSQNVWLLCSGNFSCRAIFPTSLFNTLEKHSSNDRVEKETTYVGLRTKNSLLPRSMEKLVTIWISQTLNFPKK